MIEAFSQLPPKTPTAKLIDAKMQEHWAFLEDFQASEDWKTLVRTMLWCVSKDKGFVKYLRNNFDHSPGSVWRIRYTHRKLGHVLFCNGFLGSWGCCAGIDSNGNSIEYPGWA